jgi:hypothetical protein
MIPGTFQTTLVLRILAHSDPLVINLNVYANSFVSKFEYLDKYIFFSVLFCLQFSGLSSYLYFLKPSKENLEHPTPISKACIK